MKIQSNRSYGLDALKVFATMAIVAHHFQQDFQISYDNHLNFYLEDGWFTWSYMVELFFLLSGYFMYRYVPRIINGEFSLSGWMRRRVQRLLPLVAISAICYEIVHIVYWNLHGEYWYYERPFSIWGIVVTSLGMHDGGAFLNPKVNNVTWYISILIICYCVFYLLTILSKKLKCKPYYLYIAMVLVGVTIISNEVNIPFLNDSTARGYRGFFFGLLLGQFVHTYGITMRETLLSAVIIGLLTWVMVAMPELMEADTENILCFLLFPSVVLFLESPPAKFIFRHRFWGVWGKVSFNVYVWHVVGYILMDIIFFCSGWNRDYSDLSFLYGYWAVIELFGLLSHYLIEKPLDKLVDKGFQSLEKRRQMRSSH